MKTTSFWASLLLIAFLGGICAQNITTDDDDDIDDDSVVDPEQFLAPDDDIFDEEDMVNKVNNGNNLFKARVYKRFKGKTNKELRKFLGLAGNPRKEKQERKRKEKEERMKKGKRPKRQTYTYPPNFSSITYPTSFDVSNKFPQCNSVMTQVQDQGPCGSCWAVSSAQVITDRRCIKFNATAESLRRISAWDLVSCARNAYPDSTHGCSGGYLHEAFKFYAETGVVTGGDNPTIGTSNALCKPYPLKPSDSGPQHTPCLNMCKCEYKTRTYNDDRRKGSAYYMIKFSDNSVMWQLMNLGPVVVMFDVYTDFMTYSSGIYKRTNNAPFGGYHAVKLVGWGVDSNGVKFWKALNSWGTYK